VSFNHKADPAYRRFRSSAALFTASSSGASSYWGPLSDRLEARLIEQGFGVWEW
jgi:hypothetical protein